MKDHRSSPGVSAEFLRARPAAASDVDPAERRLLPRRCWPGSRRDGPDPRRSLAPLGRREQRLHDERDQLDPRGWQQRVPGPDPRPAPHPCQVHNPRRLCQPASCGGHAVVLISQRVTRPGASRRSFQESCVALMPQHVTRDMKNRGTGPCFPLDWDLHDFHGYFCIVVSLASCHSRKFFPLPSGVSQD